MVEPGIVLELCGGSDRCRFLDPSAAKGTAISAPPAFVSSSVSPGIEGQKLLFEPNPGSFRSV
jgi:hypothetical protein